jgi:hypothetical protein
MRKLDFALVLLLLAGCSKPGLPNFGSSSFRAPASTGHGIDIESGGFTLADDCSRVLWHKKYVNDTPFRMPVSLTFSIQIYGDKNEIEWQGSQTKTPCLAPNSSGWIDGEIELPPQYKNKKIQLNTPTNLGVLRIGSTAMSASGEAHAGRK